MIESNVVGAKDKNILGYPKLMASDRGLIVLFIGEKKGVVVGYTNHVNYGIGEYREIWDMGSFKDFDGEITLKNKV